MKLRAATAFAVFFAALAACSDDDTQSTTPADGGIVYIDSGISADANVGDVAAPLVDGSAKPDTGTPVVDAGKPDTGVVVVDAGPVDAGPTGPALNGCVNYTDRTAAAASRTITWDFSVAQTPEHCMIIKAGQTVMFNGSLATHPIGTNGGDVASPITNTANITFPNAGTFGYKCTAHASMVGVVYVIP
jgi:plastocyanin